MAEGTEASRKIEAVLNEVLETNEDHEDGDILVDWVVVAFVTNVDEEKESGYPMFVSNGLIPGYRVRGLLQTGINQV